VKKVMNRPSGLRYASFKLADGVSFMHIVSHERNGHNPLSELPCVQDIHGGCREALRRTTSGHDAHGSRVVSGTRGLMADVATIGSHCRGENRCY
jgi:hypothetical protein